MTSEQAADILQKAFESSISARRSFRGETSLDCDRDALVAICRHAKEQLGFDYLIDISSIDNFGCEPRFEVVYELYSMQHAVHLRIKCPVSEDACSVATVSHLWPTADWHEREVYDMMGIRFDGHPDLRRILMWDGFPYFPLRKDFPLEGKPSDVPEVAFSAPAPLAGGPFVTIPTAGGNQEREPRARHAADLDSTGRPAIAP